MRAALRDHWPEYLIEAICLGLFMTSAFAFGTVLEHPASPIHRAFPNPLSRRLLMGLAMGGTAIAIVYSPWGKRSGAHINPSVTLTFLRLGKVKAWDAIFYVLCQFAGGLIGALAAASVLKDFAAHPAVNFVVTTPGRGGVLPAFSAEIVIAFVLMSTILRLSKAQRWHKFTGLCAGLLVAAYITLEAPISGMSMNPARSFASAVPANDWSQLWIYFTAPLIGMIAAAELHVRMHGRQRVGCAKLNHQNHQRCIFCGKPAGA